MYTLGELMVILENCETNYEIQKFAGIIVQYKKCWSILELQYISKQVNYKINTL